MIYLINNMLKEIKWSQIVPEYKENDLKRIDGCSSISQSLIV